jgi:hypothetical protein
MQRFFRRHCVARLDPSDFERQAHVLEYVKRGHKRGRLEDKADLQGSQLPPLVETWPRNQPARWLLQSGQQIEQRRFAASRRSDQRDAMAWVYVERYRAHGDNLLPVAFEVARQGAGDDERRSADRMPPGGKVDHPRRGAEGARLGPGLRRFEDAPIDDGENSRGMRGERATVRCNNGRAAVRAPGFQNTEDERFGFRVHLGGRLVRQKDPRIGGQRHGEAGACAFPPESVAGSAWPRSASPTRPRSPRTSSRAAPRNSICSQMFSATLKCSKRLLACARKPIEAPRNRARSGFGAARHRGAVNAHHAAVGLVEPGEARQQSGLAAAGRSHKRDRLAAFEGKARSPQGAHFGVAWMEKPEEVVAFKDGHVISRPESRSSASIDRRCRRPRGPKT